MAGRKKVCRHRHAKKWQAEKRYADKGRSKKAARGKITPKLYNCIQKLIDILLLSGIIIKRKAKALEATAQSVSSGAFFLITRPV